MKTVGSVSSSNASGGVTAGMIGSVQQTTVLPTLVRGPLLADFKTRYTTGASLFRTLLADPQSDAQIDAICAALDLWYGETFNWLSNSVSLWAAERFAFRMGNTVSWGLDGNFKPEMVSKRSNYINGIYPVLQNLDQLMREPSIYPEVLTPVHREDTKKPSP